MASSPSIEPAAGTLLIASANLLDPNFVRTVILLCEHQEEGSFGLVLNRQVSVNLSDVVEELTGWDAPLYQGGPVQGNTLHFLHRCPELDIGSLEVLPGVYWGGDFERVSELMRYGEARPEDFRFFVGYAGWGEDQLEGELEQDAWFVRRGREDLVFQTDTANFWRNTLRSMGESYQILSLFPDNPRLN